MVWSSAVAIALTLVPTLYDLVPFWYRPLFDLIFDGKQFCENAHMKYISWGNFSIWTHNLSTKVVPVSTIFVLVPSFILNLVRPTAWALMHTKMHLHLGKLKNGPIYYTRLFYHSSTYLVRVITSLVISYHYNQTSGSFSREISAVRYVGKITNDLRTSWPSCVARGPHTSDDPLGV